MNSTWKPRTLWFVTIVAALVLGACGGDDNGSSTEPDPDTSVDAGMDVGESDVGDDNSGADTTDDTGLPEDTGIDDTGATDAGGDDTGATDAGTDTFFDPDVGDDAGGGGGDAGPILPVELYSIDPPSGPVEGDTLLFVFGYGFTPATELLINGRRAYDVDWVDEETLLARTPANPAGTYDVKVADVGGEAILSGAFTYVADLEVDGVEPASGPTRGGLPVIISGEGFTPDVRVSFDGRNGIGTRFIDAETIETIVPPGQAGASDVRVSSAANSVVLEGGFTYIPELSLDRVVPAAGGSIGGYEVTLQGSAFTDDLRVQFGPSTATVLEVDETSATVIVPPGLPGPVDVTAVSTTTGGETLVAGFWYVSDVDGELAVDAVAPDIGSSEGGDRVTVIGPSVQDATRVLFDGSAAAIVEVFDGAIVVDTPSGDVGPADVTVEVDELDATLAGGFEYIQPLQIEAIDPAEGDVAGGITTTISGSGFTEASLVRFGAIEARDLTVVDDETIEVVVPPGSVGAVDVVVRDSGREAAAVDGFTYTAEASVGAMTPSRGAIAGNTYVLIRGDGFVDGTTVAFDGIEAPVVDVIDASTLAVRTPPHEAGTVRVTVTVGEEELTVASPFVFYDPFSPAGGWWGGEINGSVNVTTIEQETGARIEGAFVTLHIREGDREWTGVTNENGQVTISGPGLVGEQTISASAPDYSAVTVTNVDAENVMIVLAPTVPPTPGSPPPGEALPIVSGDLTGLDKITDPGPDEQLIAVIRSTPGGYGSNPPGVGVVQVVYTDGRDTFPYEMPVLPGDIAVVAVCGVYNSRTEEFTPLYMGLQRGLATRFGETYRVDVDCDIHLSQEMTFKFVNPPRGSEGPDINRAIPLLDFGSEGTMDLINVAEGDESIITRGHFAPLDDPQLEGVDYFIIGESVPRDGGLPFSVHYERSVTNVDDRITFDPFLPPAELRYPAAPGRRLVERRFEWELATDVDADFYYAYIQNLAQDTTYWEVWLPGDETGFNLPYFPDGADGGTLPDGPLVLIVLSIDAITFDYDAFEFNDFGRWNWDAYSAAGWVFFNE